MTSQKWIYMQLTKNHIAFSGNIGKIGPRTHAITSTNVIFKILPAMMNISNLRFTKICRFGKKNWCCDLTNWLFCNIATYSLSNVVDNNSLEEHCDGEFYEGAFLFTIFRRLERMLDQVWLSFSLKAVCLLCCKFHYRLYLLQLQFYWFLWFENSTLIDLKMQWNPYKSNYW